jgi:myosin protein heavy chain
MDFSIEEQIDLFKVVAATLHLGNLQFEAERSDQARMISSSQQVLDNISDILGVSSAEFLRCILKPKIKAGRDDWVTQSRNVEQVNDSVEVVARSLYERMFSKLVERINQSIYSHTPNCSFIGVLDIAGFEIFEVTLITWLNFS